MLTRDTSISTVILKKMKIFRNLFPNVTFIFIFSVIMISITHHLFSISICYPLIRLYKFREISYNFVQTKSRELLLQRYFVISMNFSQRWLLWHLRRKIIGVCHYYYNWIFPCFQILQRWKNANKAIAMMRKKSPPPGISNKIMESKTYF